MGQLIAPLLKEMVVGVEVDRKELLQEREKRLIEHLQQNRTQILAKRKAQSQPTISTEQRCNQLKKEKMKKLLTQYKQDKTQLSPQERAVVVKFLKRRAATV